MVEGDPLQADLEPILAMGANRSGEQRIVDRIEGKPVTCLIFALKVQIDLTTGFTDMQLEELTRLWQMGAVSRSCGLVFPVHRHNRRQGDKEEDGNED